MPSTWKPALVSSRAVSYTHLDVYKRQEYNYSSSDNTAGGTGYPNVGSSGMNTANQYNNEPEPQQASAVPDAGSTVPPTEVPPQQPAAPEPPKKKKHHVNGGKVARSAVALVLAAVMGFAGGYVGSQMNGSKAVSYTHLDVYKRQTCTCFCRA